MATHILNSECKWCKKPFIYKRDSYSLKYAKKLCSKKCISEYRSFCAKNCSVETLQKLSLLSKGRKPWNKGIPMIAITKEKIRQAQLLKHKITSSETKAKIRLAKKGKIYKRISKGIRYKDIWLRSSWEYNVAKKLDELNIEWQYELKSFDVGLKHNYIPDFYLPKYNLWIEVKGYWDDKSIQKCNNFKEQNNNLGIIDISNYAQFLNSNKLLYYDFYSFLDQCIEEQRLGIL